MLKSVTKQIALVGLMCMVFIGATNAAGVVSLVPQEDAVNVGDVITYKLFLQSTEELSAYQLLVEFTSLDGASASLTDTPFTLGSGWVDSSEFAGVPQTTFINEAGEGHVFIQSSLIGENTKTAFPAEEVEIGTLTVNANDAGTLNARITNANFFVNGLEQPEGANLGIQSNAQTTVDIQGINFIMGDVDGNQNVTMTDALLIAQYSLGIIGDLNQLVAADLDNNSNITMTDALLTAQISLGLIDPPASALSRYFEWAKQRLFQDIPYLAFTVLTPEPYNVGDTIEVVVSGNIGTNQLGAYGLNITYDPAVLEQVGEAEAMPGAEGLLFGQGAASEAGFINIQNFFVGTNPTEAIELAKITFTVLDTPAGGATLAYDTSGEKATHEFTDSSASPIEGMTYVPITIPFQGVEPTPTETPTETPEDTPTPTNTPVVVEDTPTPTETPVDTPTPTATPVEDTPTPTETPEDTPTPTVTPVEDTPTPTETPEDTPTPTPTESAADTPTPTPTESAEDTPTPTPVVEDTPTPTPVVEDTPTPTATPQPTPTPGELAIGPNRGLVLLSKFSVILERGTTAGDEYPFDFTNVGTPADVELVNNQPVVLTTSGNVFSNETMYDTETVIKDAFDFEPLGSGLEGFLILDRLGNVHTFGTAVHQGNASYTKTVQFGRFQVETQVPNAADLEIVVDPANATVNKGYYIIDLDGNIDKFPAEDATLSDIPAVPEGFGPVVTFDITTAGGDVTSATIMNYLGQIITWTPAGGYTTPTIPVRTDADPYLVDFVVAEGDVYILNELGEIIGPEGIINDPANYDHLIGVMGYYDLEFGILSTPTETPEEPEPTVVPEEPVEEALVD